MESSSVIFIYMPIIFVLTVFLVPAHTYFLLGDRALPEKVENLLKSNNNTLTENFEFLGILN
jgi:hypothetical protein